jgi:hypothetical protein
MPADILLDGMGENQDALPPLFAECPREKDGVFLNRSKLTRIQVEDG